MEENKIRSSPSESPERQKQTKSDAAARYAAILHCGQQQQPVTRKNLTNPQLLSTRNWTSERKGRTIATQNIIIIFSDCCCRLDSFVSLIIPLIDVYANQSRCRIDLHGDRLVVELVQVDEPIATLQLVLSLSSLSDDTMWALFFTGWNEKIIITKG